MIIINNWYGRLGNNIIQISNVIAMSFKLKHSVKFKVKHTFFNLKIIEDYFCKHLTLYQNHKIITDKCNFFNSHDSCPMFGSESKIVNKLIKSAFTIKHVQKLNENDVVIHIRSGDTMSQAPHPQYSPPPLAYYIKQLSKRDYRKIIIVCEDRKNPAVDVLLKLYENAVHNKNTLEHDIKIILGASNVVNSTGTFAEMLLKLSDNIKDIYQVSNGELNEYYLKMKPWKNTSEQRKYILDYKY